MAGIRARDSRKMRGILNDGVRVNATEDSSLLEQNDTSSIDTDLNNTGVTRANVTRYTSLCARRTITVGKGLFLVFFIYFMESFALNTVIKGVRVLLFRDDSQHLFGNFLFSLMFDTLGRLCYPLGGILADSFLGRFKVIEIGLWLLWVGLGLVCFTLSIADIIPPYIGGTALPVVCIILYAIGSGSLEVSAISFGVDQLPQGCPSEQISSYFFWLYFFRNAGTLMGTVVFIVLSTFSIFSRQDFTEPHSIREIDIHFKTIIPMMLAVVVLTCSLFLHIVKHHWYFKNSRKDSPVKTILSVTWFSLTVKRHAPIRRRTFRYGEARQPRIELAKIEYDGIFEAETVENVKTFYQLLFLIFSLGGYFACYGAVFSMLGLQISSALKLNKSIDPFFSTFVNTAVIVIVLPLVNHAILPFINVSLKIRLGIGQVFNLLAVAAATFLQGTVEVDESNKYGEDKVLWLLLPAVLLALGEMITFVTSLEFIYAQAPEQMKGLVTGLFYFIFGIFGGIGSIMFYFFPKNPHNKGINYTLWFYIMFTVIAILGLLVYTIVACLYRNRQRPAGDEDDLVRRIYAQNVFGN